MLKSNIRKKILKIREKKNTEKIQIKFNYIYKLLKKKNQSKEKNYWRILPSQL